MLGTLCILAAALGASSALAEKTGEPFFAFETMRLNPLVKKIGGQVELRLGWVPKDRKVGVTTKVIVPVDAADTPAVVAGKAVTELGKAKAGDDKIADSFDIASNGGVVTLTRKAGVKAVSAEGATRGADRTGTVPLKSSGGIDPVLGKASWRIYDYELSEHSGEFMIGCEGKEFTAPTYDLATGAPKSGDELLLDLLSLLRQEYGDRATLADGVLRVARVHTGDPFSGTGLDIGATSFSTDPNFTGFARMTVPEPTGLLVLSMAAGALAARRRRR
jgi:hypothetical protein